MVSTISQNTKTRTLKTVLTNFKNERKEQYISPWQVRFVNDWRGTMFVVEYIYQQTIYTAIRCINSQLYIDCEELPINYETVLKAVTEVFPLTHIPDETRDMAKNLSSRYVACAV